MKYLFQIYNSVYNYWEADEEFKTAAEVMEAQAFHGSYGFVTRYRKLQGV